ncbi:MAG TPA: serine hydrolase [Ramlibacter sp.]|nr:serine hydrolase [Ramlibacter sp.]
MKDTLDHPSQQRRSLLRAAGAVAAGAALPPAQAAASTGWQAGNPEDLGIAADLPARLAQGVRSGELANLHAVFVARRGRLAVESYFEGTDDRRGTPLGKVAFSPTTLHDVRSISKSVVGLLYGIALADGKVPALDTPVIDAFPAYAELARDGRLRDIRMAHVLSMTMGLDWNEDLPYTDRRNSEVAMELSPDRYRYVLDRPVVSAPGERWRYSGGATALLGHLVARGTGLPLLEFARARLFTPMGIEHVEWIPGTNGEAAAASGLRMRAGDLAKVGQLVLQRGAWDGRALVPADWIAASMVPRTTAFEGVQYGFHWYVVPGPGGTFASMGFGLGGQRLVAIPAQDLVYVIYMGNYYRADQLQRVFAVQDVIHAAIR